MASYPKFVYSDRDLYDVLEQATDEELAMLVGLMCSRVSSSIHGACRDIPAIVDEFQRFGGIQSSILCVDMESVTLKSSTM